MGSKIMALGILILALLNLGVLAGLDANWTVAGWLIAGLGAFLVLIDK